MTANSFDAHRLSHLAKQHGVQNELEEHLFAAYFTEGKNTADLRLGERVGLDAQEVKLVLQSSQYTDDVQADIYEARQLGVQGVPLFVFNRKYAVSGAQESPTFLEAIETSFAEWKQA